MSVVQALRKVPVYSLDGEVVEEVNLPKVFGFPLRMDIIKRVYLSFLTSQKQPQGRDPLAGKKVSVESFGTGREMARIPRHANGRGGFAPMTRGGYKPHPPRVDEKIYEEVNRKERRIALLSAVASTGNYELVLKRGHKFDVNTVKSVPVVVSDEIENIVHTREAAFLLQKLGLHLDVERVKSSRKIRAGKGKLRGRRFKERVGPLVVVSSRAAPALKAFRNIAGVDVVGVDGLTIGLLAPGGVPGRLTVWSKKALMLLEGWLV